MSIDATILQLARQQHGLVTTAQLTLCGVSRGVLHRRVRSGLLQPLFTGVFQVGPSMPRNARERGALLACGGGTISHVSAAAMLQLMPTPASGEPVHVTQPRDRRRGHLRPGILLHRSDLAPREVMVFEGCRITNAVRTLLDLADVVTTPDLERALARAERADPSLRDRLCAEPRLQSRARGMRQLRSLLREPAHFVRSAAESAFLTLVRRSGLPPPATNVALDGIKVDCLWRKHGLVVEVDGFAYHGARTARARDRDRDATLLAAGYRVLRIGAAQVSSEPERVVALLAQALAHGG